MQRADFLTREQFEALDPNEQEAYTTRFTGSFVESAKVEIIGEEELDFACHYFDLCRWTLSDSEYKELVGASLWTRLWEQARMLVEFQDRIGSEPELDEPERATLAACAEQAEAILEHKRALELLP